MLKIIRDRISFNSNTNIYVCIFVIIFIRFLCNKALNYSEKFLKHNNQHVAQIQKKVISLKTLNNRVNRIFVLTVHKSDKPLKGRAS